MLSGSALAKAAQRVVMKLFLFVNFINILHTNFLYECCFGSFFNIHVTKGKLPKWCSYEKFVRKMLIKLFLGRRENSTLDRREEENRRSTLQHVAKVNNYHLQSVLQIYTNEARWVNFDHFWRKCHLLRQLGQWIKLSSLKNKAP